MKILLVTDKTINKTLLGQVQLQLDTVYKGLNLEWAIEDFDYSDYPVEEYWGGFWGIQRSWLREQTARIHKRWAEEIDCVVFLISSENWNLTGVWGWNMSNQYNGYGIQQVRFAQNPRHTDERNVNNSAGTLYHELHHDHDTYVYVNTGEVVEKEVGVNNWDNDITHGAHPNWDYIRTTADNVKSIEKIMPLLIKARNARKVTFLQKKLGLLQTIYRLVMQVRALQASVREDLPTLPNNRCVCCTK